MPLLSKRKRFCVYGRYLVCRHTLDIYITSTRVIGSIAADGTSGARMVDGIGLSRRGRCPRLRQALDCLRPSKVDPEWIR
jgi:hypothetical protein